jgi:hypothetical protein
MTTTEQLQTKQKYYNEAIRYMDNAKDCLKKAQKEGQYYNDQKYVKMACGTAYSGLLVALDCFFILKDVEIDRKILNTLNSAYEILHLWGYYDGITSVKVVKEGFDNAYSIIKKIEPFES